MAKCCVVGCPHSVKRMKGIAIFKFPENTNLRSKWLEVIKIDPQTIGENTRVCALHFSETDVFHFSTKTKLKPNRVPHANLNYDNCEANDHENMWMSTSENEKKSEIVKQNKRIRKKRVNFSTQIMLKPAFVIENFMKNDRRIFYYTGIQKFKILIIIYNYVFKSESKPQGTIQQERAQGYVRKGHNLTPLNEFFLTLMKLRKGFDNETLADMFMISIPAVNRIFTAWINHLYITLGSINIFPHRDVLIKNSPASFLRNYPKVIGSIVCTEFHLQTPKSRVKQSQCFSHYKNTNTLKSLLMINGGGAIIFISALYTGSISDKNMLRDTGFLHVLRKKIQTGHLEEGDIILADKGFNVGDILKDIRLELNIPVFQINSMQFEPNVTDYIRKVSRERIHVERAIGRLNSFKLLTNGVPTSLMTNINQIYTVCALLTNFRFPIRKNK